MVEQVIKKLQIEQSRLDEKINQRELFWRNLLQLKAHPACSIRPFQDSYLVDYSLVPFLAVTAINRGTPLFTHNVGAEELREFGYGKRCN